MRGFWSFWMQGWLRFRGFRVAYGLGIEVRGLRIEKGSIVWGAAGSGTGLRIGGLDFQVS